MKMKFFRRKDKKKSIPGLDTPFNPAGSTRDRSSSGYGYGDSGPGPAQQFQQQQQFEHYHPHFGPMPRPSRASAERLAALPPPILERIFAYVCPQARDESYETCERSAREDSCMLCDLRDLSHCAMVCKRWRGEVNHLLYHSIRIDSVHYCEREVYLSDRRKHRSFFDRNAEPEDTARARLRLLSRTVREDPTRLGRQVQFLKLPYMLRESCQADIARTIAVLPNLRYVDLPEGLFMGDATYVTLSLEVQARCQELRKMTYMAGAEKMVESLAKGNFWRKLEVLELINMSIDPAILLYALGGLVNLRALKVTDTRAFTDELFYFNETLPPFPPLAELILSGVPHVTAQGLAAYASRPDVQQSLKVLTLTNTGAEPAFVQEILGNASSLKHLTIKATVELPLQSVYANSGVPLLSSQSLETLHYEISPAPTSSPFSGATNSYYSHLATSLLSGGFPNLRAIYVRDINFPDMLLGLPPPTPAFAGGGAMRRPSSSASNSGFPTARLSPPNAGGFLAPGAPGFGGQQSRLSQQSISSLTPPPLGNGGGVGGGGGAVNPRFSSNNPFAPRQPPPSQQQVRLPRTLEVFIKGDDELDWSSVAVSPGSPPSARDGASQRPLSSYGLGADVMGAGWSGARARKSVMVSSTGPAGGFLQVPDQAGPGPGDGGGGGGGGGFGHSRGTKSFGGSGAGEGEGELWPRPRSSAGEKGKGDMDLWR